MSWLDNFKLKENPSPKDMALMAAGARMMQASANQGFSASVGSGITAGLDEYQRGMKMAESTRHRKALEELRQRQLDISAAGAASTESYRNKTLDQNAKLAADRLKQEANLERSRINSQREDREFKANREMAKIMLNYRLGKVDRDYRASQSKLYGIEAEAKAYELQTNKSILESGKAKEKLAEEMARKEAEQPGFMSRLFAPNPVEMSPLDQRDPAQMSEQDLLNLMMQQQDQQTKRQQDIDSLVGAFKNRTERQQTRKLLQQMVTQPPGAPPLSPPSLPGMMQRYQ